MLIFFFHLDVKEVLGFMNQPFPSYLNLIIITSAQSSKQYVSISTGKTPHNFFYHNIFKRSLPGHLRNQISASKGDNSFLMSTSKSGRNSYGERSKNWGRSHGKDRSQRRIFHGPPLPGASNLCEIRLGWHPLRVCLLPLWSVHCLSGINENHETDCGLFTAAGHQVDHLLGRCSS